MAALIELGDVRLVVARFPWQRAIGLIGRRELAPDEGLFLPRCRAIHTVGMHIPIDVIFLGLDGDVMRVEHAVHPTRFLCCARAASVVELAGGAAERLGIVGGLSLDISMPSRGTARMTTTRRSTDEVVNRRLSSQR